jgi:hypothetical protein
MPGSLTTRFEVLEIRYKKGYLASPKPIALCVWL